MARDALRAWPLQDVKGKLRRDDFKACLISLGHVASDKQVAVSLLPPVPPLGGVCLTSPQESQALLTPRASAMITTKRSSHSQ